MKTEMLYAEITIRIYVPSDSVADTIEDEDIYEDALDLLVEDVELSATGGFSTFEGARVEVSQ